MWQKTETKLLKTRLCNGCSVISGPRRCTEPCPAGCLKVTPTHPAGKQMQCLCLWVPCPQGTICWGSGSLCPLLPGHLYHPPSDSCPEVSPAGGRLLDLIFFCTLLFFCVFSSKFVIIRFTRHRKCSGGLRRVQFN